LPNWCHNTLTVSGEADELARFVEAVRESDEQPLSFAKLVPEPSDEEYEATDEANKVTCRLCAGKGKRPVTQEEADEWGIEFHEGVVPELPFDDRAKCNGCSGSGRALPVMSMGAWYAWRSANWGCKWDASFSDTGVMALVAEGGDVEVTKEAQVATVTPTVAVYKFDTPWGPPVPFVETAAEKFPDLEFVLRFGEMGNDVAGELRYDGGVLLAENELPIDEVLAPEEMWY
jgi:hypothetical protein